MHNLVKMFKGYYIQSNDVCHNHNKVIVFIVEKSPFHIKKCSKSEVIFPALSKFQISIPILFYISVGTVISIKE